MELIPKNYIKQLELIVLFSDRGYLYTHICNRRTQAKKYIFVHSDKRYIDPKYHMLFDEVIRYDFS